MDGWMDIRKKGRKGGREEGKKEGGKEEKREERGGKGSCRFGK